MGISTLLAGAGIYFYVQSRKFVPTPQSLYEPVTVEIDSKMITEPDTLEDVPESPSGDYNSVYEQMNDNAPDGQDFNYLME